MDGKVGSNQLTFQVVCSAHKVHTPLSCKALYPADNYIHTRRQAADTEASP
jgi:hypothetical protein